LLHKKADVVEEADNDLLFLPHPSKYTQKMTAHILAGLVTSTNLIVLVIADVFSLDNFLQLFHTIVCVDGGVLLIDLVLYKFYCC
jgi:hypothetical protein